MLRKMLGRLAARRGGSTAFVEPPPAMTAPTGEALISAKEMRRRLIQSARETSAASRAAPR